MGIYQKETKSLSQKDICTPMFIAALFTIAKIWKEYCLSTDNRLVLAKGDGGGRGLDWEFGTTGMQTTMYRMDEQQGPIV